MTLLPRHRLPDLDLRVPLCRVAHSHMWAFMPPMLSADSSFVPSLLSTAAFSSQIEKMVGVARLTGCLECRRSKKRCDQVRPACGRCVARGWSCEYHSKRWTFVDQQELAMRPQPPSNHQFSKWKEAPTAIPALTSDWMSISGCNLRRTALETAAVGNHTTFLEPATDPYLGAAAAVPWTRTLVNLAGKSATTRLAIEACVLMLQSQKSSNPALRIAAFRKYTAALKGVNSSLDDLVEAQSDAILAACLALAHFERVRGGEAGKASSQFSDWLHHVRGMCRLLQLRGAARHTSCHGHALYQQCRTNAVTAAILMRRPSLFSDPEWQTIPCVDMPHDLWDELYNIKAMIPSLLCRTDRVLHTLKHATDSVIYVRALQTIQSCIADGIRLAERLEEWCEQAVAANLKDSAASHSFSGDAPTLVDLSKDCGLEFLRMALHYWAACITVSNTIKTLRRSLITSKLCEGKSMSSPQLVMPRISDSVDSALPARNIAHTAERFFSSEAGFWGPCLAAYPMQVALQYYASCGMPAPEEWIRLRALADLPNTGKISGQWLSDADTLSVDS